MSKIKNWVKGTGSYVINEISTPDSVLKSITTGTKVLRCTTAGTTALQSSQAYGEWEFDVYKALTGNSVNNYFMSSDRIGTFNYLLQVSSTNRVSLYVNGSGLFISNAAYITPATWYTIKIARLQSEGVFKDIPTLQTSDMMNRPTLGYTTFTSNGRYGFSASATASGSYFAGTADELPIVNTAKYLVEFDLKLNSGTAPSIRLMEQLATGIISNTVVTANGRNSILLTATSTTTGVLEFFNISATDYEVSGLTIRSIYPANTFAVFIKGGVYGDTATGWTLVVAGTAGTNPVTNATNTTSNYFVADLDAGDRIANIKIKNGVEQ